MNALAYNATRFDSNMIYNTESKNIRRLLLDIGFPQHLYGYSYITYALELTTENPNILHHITKELYPDIAKHFNTTPARVERAIRTAIQVTWLYGNLSLIGRIFGNSIRSDRGVPTNTQLVAGLYLYLQDSNTIYF